MRRSPDPSETTPHHTTRQPHMSIGNSHHSSIYREDEHVVALSGHVGLAIDLDRIKWRARRKDHRAIGPRVRLLGSALGLAGRVRQSKDDGMRCMLLKLIDHLLVERPALTREADQHIWLDLGHNVLQ
jgi:hypothetical protein